MRTIPPDPESCEGTHGAAGEKGHSFWGWVEADDVERLERALAGLRQSPLPAQVRLWLEASATARRLFQPEPGPSIARWSLRIADLFHGPESSSHIALAVALLIYREERGAAGQVPDSVGASGDVPDLLSRWSCAHAQLAAVAPERAEAAAAWLLKQAGVESHTSVAPDEEREWARALVLGAGLPVFLAGREPGPWVALACATAPLVSLLASWERLCLEPLGRDIDEAVLSTWVAHCVRGPAGQRVLFAYAGDRRSVSRREEVRAALTEPSQLEVVRRHWAGVLDSARALLSEETPGGEDFLRALERGFSFIETFLWFRSSLNPAPRPRPWTWESVDVDLRRAVERIERDPSWSSSLDVQRWGVAPLTADLVADWFPRGLIEAELGEFLPGRVSRVNALLLEIPPGELRYYRHWRGIPPDADSLGLMLRLASGVPGFPQERLESWLVLMAENLGPDGVPRVWFRRSAAGPTHEPPELEWAGDTCTACLLALALGLLRTDARRFDDTITSILSAALARFRPGGLTGTHHYRSEFASYLFLVIAEALSRTEAARALRESVRQCAAALVRHGLDTQRLDGSWGSPQTTAWNVIALGLHQPEEGWLTRAARYLSETQRGDGSWLPELFYYTVGKPGYMVDYRGIEVTTAICARALAMARRGALERGWTS